MANEIHKITPSAVPASGAWKAVYDGVASASISAGSNEATVQSAIEGIAAIGTGNVSVTGDESSGFTCEFIGVLANTDMLTLSYQDNTLLSAASGPSISIVQEGGVGQNEIQEITWAAGGGSFTLIWSGYGTSASINHNHDSPAISGILNPIFGLNALVSDISGGVRIEFVYTYAETDIPTPTFSSSLTGIPVTISVSVLQEGSAAPLASSNGSLALMGVG